MDIDMTDTIELLSATVAVQVMLTSYHAPGAGAVLLQKKDRVIVDIVIAKYSTQFCIIYLSLLIYTILVLRCR